MAVRNHNGFTYHCMTTADMDEVASAVYLRRSQSSGIEFARKMQLGNFGGELKEAAREQLISRYSAENWPGLIRFLTMPGLKWRFERRLIGTRGKSLRELGCFEIHCVEADAAIYRASLKWMPGFKHFDGFRVDSPTRVSSRNIASYEFSTVENLLTSPNCPVVDVAWLDFSGFLTPARVSAMQHFWANTRPVEMVVTFMDARYGGFVKKQIEKHGSSVEWMHNSFGGSFIAEQHRYCDPVPMVQVVFARKVTA